MIALINKFETLTKHISCKCQCRFDRRNVIQIIGGIIDVKTILFSVLLHVVVEMEKN